MSSDESYEDEDGTPMGGGGAVHEPAYTFGELFQNELQICCPCKCVNDSCKLDSRNRWYHAIKVLGYLEFLLMTIVTIWNFFAYVVYVFLSGLTTLGTFWEEYSIAPNVYYGIIFQLLYVWMIPLFAFVHKYRILYHMCDEERAEWMRILMYGFANLLLGVFYLFQGTGYFASVGMFQIIRIPLYALTSGIDLAVPLPAFIIVGVSGFVTIIGYILTFTLSLFIFANFIIVKGRILEGEGYVASKN